MIAEKIVEWSISLPAIFLAITVHEYAHGWTAYRCGDPTAKIAGRLTLNPLAHLDIIGALCLLLFRFGWAKPVPVNFSMLKNPKRDMIFVSIAGIAANLLIAIISALIVRIMMQFIPNIEFGGFAAIADKILRPVLLMLGMSVGINLALAIFNILPVPPLDGSKILMALLPYQSAYQYAKLEKYGFIILMVLMVTGIIQIIMLPILIFLLKIFLGPYSNIFF